MYGKIFHMVKHANVSVVEYCEHKQKNTLIDQFSGLSFKNIHSYAPRFLFCTSSKPFVQGACEGHGECLIFHGILKSAFSALRYSVPLSVIRDW